MMTCLLGRTDGKCDGVRHSLSGCGVHVRVHCCDQSLSSWVMMSLEDVGDNRLPFGGKGGRQLLKESLSCTCWFSSAHSLK